VNVKFEKVGVLALMDQKQFDNTFENPAYQLLLLYRKVETTLGKLYEVRFEGLGIRLNLFI